VGPAADVFPKTLEHVEGKKFPEFLRKSHPGNDATNCGTDKFRAGIRIIHRERGNNAWVVDAMKRLAI
jgi:hypothetical protein